MPAASTIVSNISSINCWKERLRSSSLDTGSASFLSTGFPSFAISNTAMLSLKSQLNQCVEIEHTRIPRGNRCSNFPEGDGGKLWEDLLKLLPRLSRLGQLKRVFRPAPPLHPFLCPFAVLLPVRCLSVVHLA